MTAFRRNFAARTLFALALAAYVAVGVLGHGLHSLLPCADGSCGEAHAAVGCPCGREHGGYSAPSARDSESGAPRVDRPGHDADNCTLCALLAQINAGYVVLASECPEVDSIYLAAESLPLIWPADLALPCAPRGPPSC